MSIATSRGARPGMVPADTARILLDALETIGGDADQVLSTAGLPYSYSLIQHGDVKEISRTAFARLARECVLALHFHACQRDGIKPLPIPKLRLMCLMLLACPTLKVAIETAAEFHQFTLDGTAHVDLTVNGATATFRMDTGLRSRQVGDMLVIINGLGTLHRIFGWLIREEIQLERVAFDFSGTTVLPVCREFFQQDPDMEQGFNGFTFPAFHLNKPVLRNYNELCDLFDLFPFDLLPPEYGCQSLTERTHAAIYAALSRNERIPGLSDLAKMFGLGVPTFRRHLKQEGSSLNDIRGRCRQQLAERLLKNGDHTVKEIAFRLQFGDASSFRRAFRSRSGLAPKLFREGKAEDFAPFPVSGNDLPTLPEEQ